jgi:ATP-dependent Clp protease ATP-binding subunit ClpC
MIEELVDRLSEKDYFLSIPTNVREKLVEEGFDPIYGARPLRRVITRRLEDNLSEAILSNDLPPGSSIYVLLNDEGKYQVLVDPFPN